MYIKILVYIIDNQQFKLKISIPFWLAGRLPFLFSALRGLGGAVQKTADPTARFRGGGPSRISLISPQSRIPLHVMRIPTYPSYPHIPIKSIHRPLTAFSLILLYLRYN